MEVRSLEHSPYSTCRSLEILIPVTEHERAAGGRLDEVQEHPECRRLASSVRAKETRHRAPSERKAEILHRHQVAEALGEVFGFHDGAGMHSPSNGSRLPDSLGCCGHISSLSPPKLVAVSL